MEFVSPHSGMCGGAAEWRCAAAPARQAMQRGHRDNIERETVGNEDFRRVLYTGEHLQLVLMTLQPGEEIGEEVHPDRDQLFRIEEGEGASAIHGREHRDA